MSSPLRTLIVSEVRLYCEGLAARLGTCLGIHVVAVATDAGDAIERSRDLRPDVVLCDASSHGLLATVSAFRELGVPHVVAFAVGEDEGDAIMCAEAGVSAFVERGATLEQLVETIERCVRGELALSPRIAAALFRRVGDLTVVPRSRRPGRLTIREVEVLTLLRQGLSNKTIASRLGISLPTVKNHVHHLFDKLGVHRRGEAAFHRRMDDHLG